MSNYRPQQLDDIEMERQMNLLRKLQDVAASEAPKKCTVCGYSNHPKEPYCMLCNNENV